MNEWLEIREGKVVNLMRVDEITIRQYTRKDFRVQLRMAGREYLVPEEGLASRNEAEVLFESLKRRLGIVVEEAASTLEAALTLEGPQDAVRRVLAGMDARWGHLLGKERKERVRALVSSATAPDVRMRDAYAEAAEALDCYIFAAMELDS